MLVTHICLNQRGFSICFTFGRPLIADLGKRDDHYGGSPKNRLHLAEEVVQATRKAAGEDFVIGARVNGDEFIVCGNTLKQSRVIGLRLAELGLDYLSVSAGGKFEDAIPSKGRALDPYTGYSGTRAMPPSWMPEKVNVYLCADLKKTLSREGHDITMITAGRIPTANVAEGILDRGEANMVAIARPILCDPFWPKKYKEGREKDIQKCQYCNKCREMEGAHEKVVCIQWKKKDGTIQPPKP